MSVGKRIKKLRSDLGMSQVDFAKAIGVSKQTLYKYENDLITNIPSDKIEAAAALCKVTPGFLMGWDEDADENTQHSEWYTTLKPQKLPSRSSMIRTFTPCSMPPGTAGLKICSWQQTYSEG